jgi:fatty acid amide hydrolase 2
LPDSTERSAVDLAEAIRRREFTAAEVIDAHIDRLERTGARLNALVANRFEAARSRAAEIDQEIARAAILGQSPDSMPPFLGVPFTVKESIALAGMPNTAGVLGRRGHNAFATATAVSRLIDAGAVPLGVTNTSELTLWIESDNPVYGRTNNPYDESRTAGGSSGGEAAVVATTGVAFGVGSDIGGSIRIPAMFCGVFGHKPSSGLVPSAGMWPTRTGEAAEMLALGPITRHAADLMPLLRIMAGPEEPDPIAEETEPPAIAPQQTVLREPSEVSLDGLTVTVVEDSSLLPMDRELRDARERAVGALASAGAITRTVSMPEWRTMLLPFLAVLQDTDEESAGVAELLREAGEPHTSLFSLVFGSAGGHTLPTRLALLAEALPSSLTGGRPKLLARARDLAERLEEAIGDGVLLHPAHLNVAPPHGRTYGRPWLLTPAAVFNLAGVPVTEVPLGLSAAGLPLGVQVAAAHGEDHMTIAIALELEAVFGGWVPPPWL